MSLESSSDGARVPSLWPLKLRGAVAGCHQCSKLTQDLPPQIQVPSAASRGECASVHPRTYNAGDVDLQQRMEDVGPLLIESPCTAGEPSTRSLFLIAGPLLNTRCAEHSNIATSSIRHPLLGLSVCLAMAMVPRDRAAEQRPLSLEPPRVPWGAQRRPHRAGLQSRSWPRS